MMPNVDYNGYFDVSPRGRVIIADEKGEKEPRMKRGWNTDQRDRQVSALVQQGRKSKFGEHYQALRPLLFYSLPGFIRVSSAFLRG
jgi:hypothetical protein